MPNTAVRIYSTGVLSSNGEFDEVSRISSNGLLLYYDGAKSYSRGGNTVYDLSSSNNNGILVGTSTFTTANAGHFIQNGSVGYITSTTPYSNLIEFSIGVWFKTPTTSRASKLIGFSNGFAGSNYLGASDSFTFETSYDRQLYIGSDNKVYFGIYPNQVVTINTTPTYTDNVWHYAVGTFSGSQSSMRLYVDGVLQASNTQFSTAQSYTGRWKIGAGSLGGWPASTQPSIFYDGSLGPATVYSRALPATEVLQNYNLDAARFGRTFSSYTASKTSLTSLSVAGEFDEVTYNASSNVQVNLVSHSQDFTQGSQWTAISGLTVTTPGFRAPDGTPTAQLLTGNGVTTGYLNTTFPWRVGNNYTFSCYFKSGTLSVVTIYLYGSYFGTTGTGGTGCDFNLANGTATPFGGAIPIIQNVGDGWYRCSVTAPAYIDRPVGDFGCQAIRMSSATGTVYAWGYQIEQSSTPSIYVRTGASGAIVNTFRQRITSNGNNYVIGSYDERSGIPVSEGLIVYLDASLAPSYNGSGTNWTGISSNKANASITSSSGGVTTSYGFNKAFDTITLNDGNLIDGQIRITGVDFNTLAQSNNFTVMFAAKKDYYGSSGNLVGNSELFQAVNNGYGTGWRITEESQGSLGTPFTGTHAWNLSMSPAATPTGWGLGVSDTSTNRMCIVAFSVSPTTVYGFCNGNTTTTTNPGTYAGSTSRGYISFTGAGAGSFNGQIGFFMVYNRALSLVEMTQNYNAFRRRYNL
jgi:hypothetical protein